MRKIDKTKILATQYKSWEEKQDFHPSFSNKKERDQFYIDIVANLIHLQKGVCAYSEIMLCKPERVKEEN